MDVRSVDLDKLRAHLGEAKQQEDAARRLLEEQIAKRKAIEDLLGLVEGAVVRRRLALPLNVNGGEKITPGTRADTVKKLLPMALGAKSMTTIDLVPLIDELAGEDLFPTKKTRGTTRGNRASNLSSILIKIEREPDSLLRVNRLVKPIRYGWANS